MVSQELIIELQGILKQEYGESYAIEEVSEIGNTLVRYFEFLTHLDQKSENLKEH